MNKEEVKQKIIEEIKQTENDVKSLKDLTKPISPENAIGRISRMDAINNKSINDASLIQSQDKLKKLITALEKIDDKSFGICIRCEKPIPLGRIMLMPHSTKCVNCA